MLVISVCAMVCGIEDFVGIESWSKERIDWLRRFLPLKNGIPSHDTLGRLFGLLDRQAVEKSFRAWVGSVVQSARDILQKVIRANSHLSSKQNATLH